MSKDVILDRYARLYEIPHQLARRGHQVLGLCLSYQNSGDGNWQHETDAGHLEWESRSVGTLWAPALLSYPARILRRLRAFRPDVVIGASDIPHVYLGAWLAKRLGVPYVADLYDNFEGFGQSRIPGMKPGLRRAVRAAAVVTTTSQLLAEKVVNDYGAKGIIVALPSTVDTTVFHPGDVATCRTSLGLPTNAQLIGTAGGLHRDKGVGTLYSAWELLAAEYPDLHLVLAGPYQDVLPPPTHPRVHYLGQIEHSRTAALFSALDVGVIYLRNTPFGHYCFPQKAYEMLACNTPIVAANVGEMAKLFEDLPECLYEADNVVQLAQRIRSQLQNPLRLNTPIQNWEQLLSGVAPHFEALSRG